MSQTSTSKKSTASLYSTLYIVLSTAIIFLSVSGLYASSPLLTAVSGLPGSLVVMYFFYAALSAFDGDTKNVYLCILIPALSAPLFGIYFSSLEASLYSLIDFAAFTLAAALIYSCASGTRSRSSACAYSAFVLFASSMLETVIAIYLSALSVGKSFEKFLFEGIEEYTNFIIQTFNAQYTQNILEITEITGSEISMPQISTEYLADQIYSTIAFSPAIIYVSFFFIMFIFTYVIDALGKKSGLYEELRFTKYTVSGPVHLIFNITGIIFMLSIFFENEMSPFTCGILCTLISVLPNYIILGYRRLFTIFAKNRSALFGVFITVLVTLFGLFIFPLFFLFAVVLFGLSELKRAKLEAEGK